MSTTRTLRTNPQHASDGTGRDTNPAYATHYVSEPTPAIAAALAAGMPRDHVVGDTATYALAVQPKHANQGHVAYTAAMWEAKGADKPAVPGHLPAVTSLDWHGPTTRQDRASRYYGTGIPTTWLEGQKVDYVLPADQPKGMSDTALRNRANRYVVAAENGTADPRTALVMLERAAHLFDVLEYDALVERVEDVLYQEDRAAVLAQADRLVWTTAMLPLLLGWVPGLVAALAQVETNALPLYDLTDY